MKETAENTRTRRYKERLEEVRSSMSPYSDNLWQMMREGNRLQEEERRAELGIGIGYDMTQ